MDLILALLERVPPDARDAARSLVVQWLARWALPEINGLAVLADIEAVRSLLGDWLLSPLASPEPSTRIDCSEPLP